MRTFRSIFRCEVRRALRARRASGSAGFTLIELIIAVSLMGIVIAVLGAAFVTVFNTQASTGQRISESSDAQVASAFLANDVQSIDRLDIPSSCGSSGSDGSELFAIRLVNGSTVSYRQRESQGELIRVLCPSSGSNQRNVLANHLKDEPIAVACDDGVCNDGTRPYRIELALQEANEAVDGSTVDAAAFAYSLVGARRTDLGETDPDDPAFGAPPFLSFGGDGTSLLKVDGSSQLLVNGDLVIEFDEGQFTASELEKVVVNNGNGKPGGIYAENGGRFLIEKPGECNGCDWTGKNPNTSPEPTAYEDPIDDPYSALTPPSCLDLTPQVGPDYTGAAPPDTSLEPGCYAAPLVLMSVKKGGKDFGDYTFAPGRYLLLGGLQVNGSGVTLTGDGVGFYVQSGAFDLGQGVASFTGAYQDANWPRLFVWQPSSNTSNISMSGNGSLVTGGALYAPGSIQGFTLGAGGPTASVRQVIATNINLSGTAVVRVGY